MEFDFFGSFDTVYVVNDVDVVGSDNLSAVCPICFVAIVFLGVVGGSDVDTALTTEVTDGKRKLGSGTEAVEEVNLDSVGREDVGNDFSKLAAVVAHVVSNDNGNLGEVGKCFLEVVGESLSGCANGVYVHAVGTGTHDAA